MRISEIGEQSCPVAQALAELGDSWSILIIREAFYGRTRFSDFVKYTGAQKTVVSARLDQLVGHGVLERARYSERPPRDEYLLTEKGRDFAATFVLLARWGQRWAGDGEQTPFVFGHHGADHDLAPTLGCAECGEALDLTDLTWRRGDPG